MVALVSQKTMHIADEAQILLVSTCLAYRAAPFFDRLKYLRLDAGISEGRSLGESPDKFIEKLLGTNLEMERIAAVLDTNIEETESEQADIGVAGIDVVDDARCGFTRGSPLFTVDQIGNFEVEGKVGLVNLGTARARDEALEL